MAMTTTNTGIIYTNNIVTLMTPFPLIFRELFSLKCVSRKPWCITRYLEL